MKVDQSKIENLREDYRSKTLLQSDVAAHPVNQFDQWFLEALNSEIPEPNVMTVATATKDGRPSARILLLKGYNENGFVFYTNYNSRKGKELEENPQAAMVFCWLELQRQVRIEGSIEQMDAHESEQYFQSRPRGSQIGAWASPQSEIITDRTIIEANVRQLNKTYEGVDKLPRPAHWGGYRLKPHTVEFWQGQTSRLHDRICYTLNKAGEWQTNRLAP